MADGTLVEGEANIDVPKHDSSVPIQRVYLKPEAQANPEAVQALRESDFIIFAPGNLYTSTIPNLLVNGIPEALQHTRAPMIYILNLMTRHGETDGYSARNMSPTSGVCRQTAGRGHRPPGRGSRRAGAEISRREASQVKLDIGALHNLGVKVVKFGNVMSANSLVRHDPARTAHILVELFEELGGVQRR